jgi:hypothetical protein
MMTDEQDNAAEIMPRKTVRIRINDVPLNNFMLIYPEHGDKVAFTYEGVELTGVPAVLRACADSIEASIKSGDIPAMVGV